jgi:hypothetical protein
MRKKKGKGFYISICVVFCLFLQRLQAAIDKLVASHESEEMMPKTTSIVENGLIDVKSSQRAADEFKVSSEESMTKD